MIPEVVIDRLQSFLRWNAHRVDALDEAHDPVEKPAYYTRGKNGKKEYWILAPVWRDDIFDGDEGDAERAAQALRDAGLLRVQSAGDTLQCTVGIRRVIKRAYCVNEKIVTYVNKVNRNAKLWLSDGLNNLPNGNGSANGHPLPALSPPVVPANFNELPAAQKQDFLLSNAMYLQNQLLAIAQRLAPDDAKSIAQLASVAQGIVKTSIELDQLRVTGSNFDALKELAREVRAMAANKADGERA